MRYIYSTFTTPLFHCGQGLICLIVFGLGLPSMWAQPADSIPLPEELFPQLQPILAKALSQSSAMLTANSAIVQAEALKVGTNSLLLPKLDSATYYVNQSSVVAVNADVWSQSSGVFYSLSMSQPIFQWGTYKAQVDSAKIGVLIAEKNYAEAYRLLALSIRSQFIGLILKKKYLRNAEFALKLTQADLQLEEEKLRNGMISTGSLMGPRMAVSDAQLGRDRVRLDLDQARHLFSRLTGTEMIEESLIPDDLMLADRYDSAPLIQPMLAKFAGDGVKHTFQAQIYGGYVRQADLYLKVAKYRLYPKFSLSAALSQQSVTSAAENYVAQVAVKTKSVNIIAVWSLFDGFAAKSAKLSALTSKRTAERQLENYLQISVDQARDLGQALNLASRAMQLADTRQALQWSAVELGRQDLVQGVGSQRAVDTQLLVFYQIEYAATAARVEFIRICAEFRSALNSDPAMKNLPTRFISHAK